MENTMESIDVARATGKIQGVWWDRIVAAL